MEKKANYKGFCEHVAEYGKIGASLSLSDLKKLAIKYNTPIPRQSSSGDLEWPDETK